MSDETAQKKSSLPERVSEQRQLVVEQIISSMEAGKLNWSEQLTQVACPHNPISGTTYRGRNRIHLAVMGGARGYDDNRWVTFNQAKKAGWDMKKGAKSAIVEKWKAYAYDAKEDEDGEIDLSEARIIRRCVGYWSVFNACEFKNVPEQKLVVPSNDLEISQLADEIIASSRCPVKETVNTHAACWYPESDYIKVYPRNMYTSNEAFVATLLHEMGHATGHPSALNRDMDSEHGSKGYAREELIAELSSVFSCADFGLSAHAGQDPESEHFKNHVAYLQGWCTMLRDKPDELFSAASAAESATEYIVNRYEETQGKLVPAHSIVQANLITPSKEPVQTQNTQPKKEPHTIANVGAKAKARAAAQNTNKQQQKKQPSLK